MAGLKFHKIDLHVHTPASHCYLDKTHTPKQIVEAALQKGLSAIAITDHNSAEWIDCMKEAALGTPLIVFPGVEVSLEHYHLVALFDPQTHQTEIENFLGALGIQVGDYGKSETICTKTVYDVIDIIHNRKGLAILAHIDAPKGAFFAQTSQSEDGKIHVPQNVVKLFNEAAYDAVECVNGKLPIGYDRAHHLNRFPPVYQASDNPHPEHQTKHSLEGIGTTYSWFKLDQIDLEGLRQCFADPEVRIRLMDVQTTSVPRILSLQVGDGGFLRNQKFEFHEGLNSIIGGKGVGKSLLVEFLRFALEQPPQDDALHKDHVRKLDACLGAGNYVTVQFQTADGVRYEVKRFLKQTRKEQLIHEHTCINLDNGSQYRGDIPSLLPILAYSQTEVIKIAEDRNAQLRLIDRFIETQSFESEIQNIKSLLNQNDQNLCAAIEARNQLISLEKDLETLQSRLDTLDHFLSHPVFEKMKAAEAEQNAFTDQLAFAGKLIDQIQQWEKQLQKLNPPQIQAALSQIPQLAKIVQLNSSAKQSMLQILQQIREETHQKERLIHSLYEEWLPRFKAVEEAYKAHLQEMGGERREKENERQKLLEQKYEIDRRITENRALSANLETYLNERNLLLDQLERVYQQYYEKRLEKYEQLNQLSDGKLKLDLEHAADRSRYDERLKELLRGTPSFPSTDREKVVQNILPRRLIQLVLDRNVHHLANEADITELWAERLIEKLWSAEDFTKVLALQHDCYPRDVPSIRYRKASTVYGELSELSVGQKCTALLIVALCDGNMPVIIDQPEDALDVATVWEDISKKLRRGKEQRQFIITTHNSSVAVGSDSDQFIVLQAGSTDGKVVATGAIDRPQVRQAVVQHLEGGDEPYILRAKKYNIQ